MTQSYQGHKMPLTGNNDVLLELKSLEARRMKASLYCVCLFYVLLMRRHSPYTQ